MQKIWITPSSGSPIKFWMDLWEVSKHRDLMRIKAWHDNASISELVKETLPTETDELSLYKIANQVAHFSPMGLNLIARTLILQATEVRRVQELIQAVYIEIYRLTKLIDEWLGSNCMFRELAPILAQFRNSLVRPIPPTQP